MNGKRAAPRPFVLVNMAMTADGKIATANRAVSSFGSQRDMEHLYELRATADAVMSGARTIDLNPVKMGPGGRRFRELRLRNGLAEFNLRVIVTGSGTLDPNATVFKHRFSPILVLTTGRASPARVRALRDVADEVFIAGEQELDFPRAVRWLRSRWKVSRLLCEGGGALNDALIRANLVDELHVTLCPKVFGGRAAPTIADGLGIARLKDAKRFVISSMTPVESELFLVYRACRPQRNRNQNPRNQELQRISATS
jgi:riboflavin-specific deaminase-like protein